MNAAWPMKTSLLLVLTTSIAGCATGASDDTAHWGAVSRAAGAVLAPSVRPYTADELARARAELATLPPGSVVAGVMISDYLRMRDQSRKLGR